MGLRMQGLQHESPEVREGFGLALAARASGCSSVLQKWEHYLMHATMATHVTRFFAEQADPNDRNWCSSCSSCHRYSEEACHVPMAGRTTSERRAVVATVLLLYRMWQQLPPFTSISNLYRTEDTFDGWGLRFKESRECSAGGDHVKYPFDLHNCKDKLLKEGQSLTLTTSMAFSNKRDVWTKKTAGVCLRWQLQPPRGHEFMIGAMPAKTDLMGCKDCAVDKAVVGWDPSEVVLLQGSKFTIEEVIIDDTFLCTTVYARQA
eukprot:TRINITY_DN7477_c0_g2_i1.p1 TRINITY_DN7477_c0_g2~~TRINITY_DN7477_c0_g2_i1.p1  ORF type:complete len:262 (+),score=36.35 TRINITY_DN7477_c0_g2_i1:162-947(+)